MQPLIRKLCQYATGVVADDNDKLFAALGEELPLTMFRFKSGDTYNGWEVPQNWRVKSAKLLRDGREVFDGRSHTLGVARYSKSFSGTLDWEQLKPFLVTNPELPEAYMFHCMWQYRPWDAQWAYSMPAKIHQSLGPGRYQVELETEYQPGEMLVAHCHKAGRSDRMVVFNSNTCHPHMANDGFAGTTVLIRLFQWLAARDTHYSYRLVLGPEHLGSVFYLRDLPREEVDRMVCGVFEEMPGTQGPLKAASTFLGGHMLDQAMANALRHHSRAHQLVPWRQGAGNDETVWEAPGFEVPFIELTRCEDFARPYREYHSSLDVPALMDDAQLQETLEVLKRTVDALEQNATMERMFDGLICLSNPSYGLYMERPDPTVEKQLEADSEKWGYLVDCLPRYLDGGHSILDIALKHDLPFSRLRRYFERFEEKGLVRLQFAEIERAAPRRVTHRA
jgi:aminopeptidase-like protein